MVLRNRLSDRDASERENVMLDTALRGTTAQQSNEKLVSVEEAIAGKRMFSSAVKRSALRVLFISQDTRLLNPSTQSLDGYVQLKDLFEEVHILILRTGIPAKYPALRVDSNVWMYTATAKAWWRLPKAGINLLEQELVFANGFRPDLVVARDPFESGLVGKALAQKYEKPLQIHVLKNYNTHVFRKEAGKNVWRRFLPRYTIPKAISVRADTKEILEIVKERFNVPDLSLLPKYHSYKRFAKATPKIDLKEKYRPFIFFFLFIGKLDSDSTAYQTIDALRTVLQNPRICLLILGDGPAKSEFQKRAKILGIEKQIVFESRVADLASYLKGAHVAMVTDTTEYADEALLQAAAAGLPAIMTQTERRADLFEDNVSGLLCAPDDTTALTKAVNELLNNAGKRNIMGEYAARMVRERFHDSEHQYQEAFRNSIEETILVEEQSAEKNDDPATPAD